MLEVNNSILCCTQYEWLIKQLLAPLSRSAVAEFHSLIKIGTCTRVREVGGQGTVETEVALETRSDEVEMGSTVATVCNWTAGGVLVVVYLSGGTFGMWRKCSAANPADDELIENSFLKLDLMVSLYDLN